MFGRAGIALVRASLSRNLRVSRAQKGAKLVSRAITSTNITYNEPNEIIHEQEKTHEEEEKAEAEEQEKDLPWYLRQEEATPLTKPIFKAEMPELPQDTPDFIKPILEHMIELGLDEFKVFNIKGRADTPMSTFADHCVICQGKSDKHLQNASQELITYFKHTHEIQPFVEGLVKPNSTVRMKKRLKMKKQDDDFGLGVNSWIMIDTKMGVFLNLLTPERRRNVNLEYLWCKPEERPQYEPSMETVNNDDDSIFAGIFKRFYSTTVRDDLPLSIKALQTFKIGDQSGYAKLIPEIRQDPESSLVILDGILNDLKQSDFHKTFETVSERNNHYFYFFNRSFPQIPSKNHWIKRFEFLNILHNLSPAQFPFRFITSNFLLQAASGVEIDIPQLKEFVRALSTSNYYNNPLKIMTKDQLGPLVAGKYKELTSILEVVDAKTRNTLDDEIVLDILKLGTQHHLFARTEETLPISGTFDVILELFKTRQPTLPIMEFVLVSYLKASEVDKFYGYWDSLHEYKADDDKIVMDSRPWELLLQIIKDNYHEGIVERLIHEQIPVFLDNDVMKTSGIKQDFIELLNRFDQSGQAYPELRQAFA